MLRINFPASLHAVRHRIVNRLSTKPRPIGISYDPSDRGERINRAKQLFQIHGKEEPLGTIGRGRLILRLIEDSFPTQDLSAEYFGNLAYLLKTREKREVPGQVILGLGTGRSGSTSLVALFATVTDSCCTHENPPMIFWTPEEEQVQFHIRRFKLLSEYFSLVVDVSHWWLNALDRFFPHFPDSKVIGMFREVDQCTKSFMRIKQYGRQTWNHWVPYGNGIWISNLWDATYPTYSVPSNSETDPDLAKYDLISRYVREYNAELSRVAVLQPNRIMLVPTEDLNKLSTQARIFDFASAHGRMAKFMLNVRSTADGANVKF